MNLDLPQANVKLKSLTVEELVIKSGNGSHEARVVGREDGVGILIQNGKSKDMITLSAESDRVAIGIHSGEDQAKLNPMTFAITLAEGKPVIQVVVNGQPQILPIGSA